MYEQCRVIIVLLYPLSQLLCHATVSAIKVKSEGVSSGGKGRRLRDSRTFVLFAEKLLQKLFQFSKSCGLGSRRKAMQGRGRGKSLAVR